VYRVYVLSVEKCGSCVGVEILAFPLTSHIAYTTACCYRTSRDVHTARYCNVKSSVRLSVCDVDAPSSYKLGEVLLK